MQGSLQKRVMDKVHLWNAYPHAHLSPWGLEVSRWEVGARLPSHNASLTGPVLSTGFGQTG